MSSSHASDPSDPPSVPPPSAGNPRGVSRFLDELPAGILLLDPDGIVLRVNEPAAKLLGYASAELLGKNFFREVFPELERDGTGPDYRRQAEQGQVELSREATLLSPQGSRQLCLTARSAAIEQARWGVVVVEDRSELADEVERRKRAERLAAVGEVAAGVAHEINNPLASIKSFAQFLARDGVTPEQRHALEIIIQESTRIARVVENLQTFARQQGVSGREPVNLSLLAEQVLELQRYSLGAEGIEVRKDLDDDLSLVMGEPGALQQVILNLVVNAEQVLADKPGHRLLIVRTRESTEGVLLSVVDNGPGISREKLPRIFESLAGDPAHGGGVGLGVCATIVREHGGEILAESEEGRGAAFFVRLPRAGSEASVAVPHPAPPEPAPQPRRSLRVLVADDEPTLRLAIALFLGRRGHQVTEAADAYEALRLAEEQEFDVALVDARMPGDGIRLLEQLEAISALRGRTALMTGDLGRTRTTQGTATGRPYLVKPFDMAEAVNLIEKLGQ